MPIWLRKFTFNKIKEHFDKLNEKSKDPNAIDLENTGKIKTPEFLKKVSPPTYTAKKSPKK